jgi:DNA-binding Lrp family transcriptional regulator
MIPPEFLIIPYLLIQDPDIRPLDERVYGVIYWLTRLKGERCTASNLTLAEICNVTPRGVQNSLCRLEKKGYIERIVKDKKSGHRDEIVPMVVFQWNKNHKKSHKDSKNKSIPHEQPFVGPRTAVRGGPRTDDDHNNNNINNKNKEYIPTTKNVVGIDSSKLEKLIQYFFKVKGVKNGRENRYLRSAKELLILCDGNLSLAKAKILSLAVWAREKGMDYEIDTAVKRYLEL